jgi:hypothetical protein
MLALPAASLAAVGRGSDVSALAASHGALQLDGKPFFPILTWGQCADDAAANLAVGITVFMGDSCDDTPALAGVVYGHGYVVADVGGRSDPGLSTLPDLIGWHQPDEADGYGIASETLPAPDPASGRLTFLTLTSRFASDQRMLTTRRPASFWASYVARADVIGFDLYPLAQRCDQKGISLGSVYREQRDLVRLAGGRPTYQWIEATPIFGHCGAAPVSPAALRAEVFLAVAGGANGIGYFTHAWPDGTWERFAVTPELRDAMAAINADLHELAPVLAGPQVELARATGPILVGVRRAGRHLLLIAVNPTGASVRAQIRLRGVRIGSVLPWREHRTLKTARSAFTDHFEPLQVHVYDVAP